MAVCLLLRHGRTTANADGVLAGWTPGVALDGTGRAQAERLGDRLAGLPVRRIVTSPLQRCRETASYVAAHHRAAGVQQDPDLGECRYGAWTGRALKELAEEPLWRTVQDQPSAARFPPSTEFESESIPQLQARAVATVRRIDAEVEAEHGPQALWVAVSHGDVLKTVLADVVGAHLDSFQRLLVAPGAVSLVRYTDRRPFLITMNDTGGGLAELAAPEEREHAAAEAGVVGSGDAPVGGGAGAR